MAADDYAILVGISEYPSPGFLPLDGPINDLKEVRRWLEDPTGGNVPDTHIETIDSSLCPNGSDDFDPFDARPSSTDFERVFLALERQRMKLKRARVKGRLYLYFSGHGFCSREIDRDAEAALYAANASRDYYPHIYGTYFARRVKAKALFSEVVLIMDCCRDSEINRRPVEPTMSNTPDDSLAADVSVLAIYAVPRGGKAYERPIDERNGEVHGLLTHAFLKTLEEARPTGAGTVSATRVRDHLLENWEAICGDDPPPAPDVYLPTREIDFAAKNAGVVVTFAFSSAPANGAMLVVRDGNLKAVAHLGTTGSPNDDLIDSNGPILSVERHGSDIELRVLPGFYEYELGGPNPHKDSFKAQAGGVRVTL